MATKKKAEVDSEEATVVTEETDAKAAETTVKTAETEKKYSIEMLKKYALKTFGVTQSTFAGAAKGIEDKEYTISEMQEIINAWKQKGAK